MAPQKPGPMAAANNKESVSRPALQNLPGEGEGGISSTTLNSCSAQDRKKQSPIDFENWKTTRTAILLADLIFAL